MCRLNYRVSVLANIYVAELMQEILSQLVAWNRHILGTRLCTKRPWNAFDRGIDHGVETERHVELARKNYFHKFHEVFSTSGKHHVSLL